MKKTTQTLLIAAAALLLTGPYAAVFWVGVVAIGTARLLFRGAMRLLRDVAHHQRAAHHDLVPAALLARRIADLLHALRHALRELLDVARRARLLAHRLDDLLDALARVPRRGGDLLERDACLRGEIDAALHAVGADEVRDDDERRDEELDPRRRQVGLMVLAHRRDHFWHAGGTALAAPAAAPVVSWMTSRAAPTGSRGGTASSAARDSNTSTDAHAASSAKPAMTCSGS